MRRRELLYALGAVGALGAGGALSQLSSPYIEESERSPLATLRYDIDPKYIPGVSKKGLCASNAQALRGQLFVPGGNNVLLVGGSTVYCQLLDEKDALHHQVRLGMGSGARVATSARGGTEVSSSIEHVKALAALPRTRPRLVIGMLGVNDMIDFYIHWKWPKGLKPVPIPANSPFAPKNQKATHADFRAETSDGRWFPKLAKHYRDHSKLESLSAAQSKQLDKRLQAYRGALRGLASAVEDAGARLLLATQPLAFAGSDDDALTRQWCLYINPRKRQGFVPSPTLMAEMLGRTNDVTRAFAQAREIPLVDLADLSGKPDTFYDQWHFSVNGARVAGARLGEAAALMG